MGANVMRTFERLAAFFAALIALGVATAALAQAPGETLFGPQKYVRTTGAPNVYTASFSVPASAGAPFQLRILNGAPNGDDRITSGWVKVNGVQVVGPADFGQNVGLIERSLNLGPNNTLEVQLASKPGGYITLTVLGTRILPVPTSLAPSPVTITAGAIGTLTATLSPSPTAAGSLSLTSANTSVATVPASVPFAAGQSSVQIPVSGVAAGSTAVTASANGGSASATVNVTPAPPTIASLAPAALSVMQSSSGTLTVTISAAQAGDTPVSVASSNSAIASVPSSVSVPAGQLSAQIPVSALSPGDADVTASLNGSSATSRVSVTALPPTVVSLVPTISTVTLGASTSLTLTISAAQSADTAVLISVSPAGAITAPAQVVVPAGQLSAQVPIGTVAYGQAGVSASLNGSTASALVNVVPPPVVVTALEPATFTMNVGVTSTFTVRINAAQTTNTEIALESSNTAVLQVPPAVTVAQGATTATFTASAFAVGDAVITASANNTSRTSSVHVAPQPAAIVSLLPTPLPLQQGATGTLTVTINVAQEANTTIALANSVPAVASVPASVTIAAGAVTATIPVNALEPGATQITASVNATSATASVEVTPPPPVVTAITPATLSLPKGTPGVLRVTVSRAPNVATAVALSSSDQAVASVPAQVNIPAGALFADFPVAANAVGAATISASLNGGSATSTVTVAPAELVTLTLSPQQPTNYVGESVQFTVTGTMTDGSTEDFTGRATWSSSNADVARVSGSGVASLLAAGQATIGASFTFTAVQTGTSVTVSTSTLLTVKTPTQLVLSAPNTTLTEGNTVMVTITTSDAPPYGGLVVHLGGSGTGGGTFPSSVTIPEYQTSATFDFTATAAGSYTITATAQNRLLGSITFSIQPLLVITAVSPASAEVGATITLTGSGFDPVSANNQLVFRGINNTTVSAVTLTATATQLTVRVPPLAESGPITLTNSRGITQSPTFTVTREQDFQLVVSPAAVTVYQGASNAAQAQLSSTGTRSFTGLVTLSVQGLPAGVSASFAPAATLSAFQSGTVTLTATSSAAPGNYPLTVQATSSEGGVAFVRSSALTVTVASSTGVTGVKGRFVTPEGNGIGGVIARADIATNPQPQTTTDAAGNFTLAGLPPGTVTFRFDATPANPLYPIWPYTMTVTANQVSVIPDWTINPPPSDDKFVAIANATQDQSIRDARFPGLEIKLPAGVTITGWDGVVKSRIAVERIMPDKLPVSAPPFPMREAYQLYFGTPMGGIPSQPIPVTLPNVAEREPGEQVEIWFFDGSPMGGSGEWKLAGMGTVSPDGKTVASNPGVGIPRFCGVCGLLSLSCPPPPNPPQPPPDGCPTCGKPVDLFTGQELMTMGLLGLDGLLPIDLSLKYNPVDAYNDRAGTVTGFGFGWTASYDIGFLPFAGPQKRLVMPGGRFVNFVDDGSGTYTSFDDPKFDGAVLTPTNAAASEWQLRLKSGMIWRFKPFAGVTGVIRGGPPTFLTEIVDPVGNSLTISRLSNGRITAIGTPERNLRMTYGTNGFVSQLTDTANRTMRFTYTASNRLHTVTDADGKVGAYTYVDDSEIPVAPACAPQQTGGERIKTVLFPGRARPAENFYGAGRRVLRQVGVDGREFRMAYKVTGACVTHVASPGVRCTAGCPDVDSWENFQAGWRIHGGRVVGTTVTNPNGTVVSHTFGAKGLVPSFTNAEGQPTRIKYDKSNRPVEITDALGRTRKMEYDEAGNVSRVTDPLGRNMDFVYDPRWGKTTRITRYLPDGTPVIMRYAFDSAGRRISSTDPLDNVTLYGYSPRGELASFTRPGNRTSTYHYNGPGDLVRQTNSLGNELAYETDGAGRVTAITDPLGFTTRMESNGHDDVTKVIDALQGETRYVLDAANRLSSVIDPRNNAIESYQYDPQDRLSARLDAFSKITRYDYDSAGRVSRYTDRKGQVIEYAFDAKDRPVRVDYAGVVLTITYDAAGRVAELREPDNAVGYTYDVADRMVVKRTDTASGRVDIGYEYDTLDRVVRRTLNGGDPTDYTYDKAGRLLTIVYRGRTTAFAWDELGRMTSKTLPGGISQKYSYDDADRLTRIEYARPDGSLIDTVTYGYDAKGQRISKSTGSPSVQETPIVGVYDAANRLTSLTVSGRSYLLAYDDNGNLRTRTDQASPADVTTYSWDVRNRLVGLSGPGVEASFAYDVVGRRTSKTINGVTTSYLYDADQAIAEISGGASKSILSGLAMDEVIARYTDAGERSYLTDALGSVIAQAKADLTIQNFYSYTPYGEATSLGDDEGNPIQYTGRENDLTGLYFYRARYYDPVLKRFITEDPIGLRGGTNVYAYVNGAPTFATDPSGLCTYLGTFYIRTETEHWIINGRGYIRSETWTVPDYSHWHCHILPGKAGEIIEKWLPPCMPSLKRKTWDLYELGSQQFTRTYELWEAYYMCNPTCDDNIADRREKEIRNRTPWKETWNDLRKEWIPRDGSWF